MRRIRRSKRRRRMRRTGQGEKLTYQWYTKIFSATPLKHKMNTTKRLRVEGLMD